MIEPVCEVDTMNIDWDKTTKLNVMSIDELKSYFKKYPESHKKIIAVCEGCGVERELCFRRYNRLCMKCAKNLPEYIEADKQRAINQWSNPEARVAAGVKSVVYWSDPAARKKQSDTLMNSPAHNKQRGGLDIVGHHIAYDFLRPNALAVEITRSFHAKIHSPKGLGVHQRGYSLID